MSKKDFIDPKRAIVDRHAVNDFEEPEAFEVAPDREGNVETFVYKKLKGRVFYEELYSKAKKLSSALVAAGLEPPKKKTRGRKSKASLEAKREMEEVINKGALDRYFAKWFGGRLREGWKPIHVFKFGVSRRLSLTLWPQKKDVGVEIIATFDNLEYVDDAKTWIRKTAYTIEELAVVKLLIDQAIQHLQVRDYGTMNLIRDYGAEALVELVKTRKEPSIGIVKSNMVPEKKVKRRMAARAAIKYDAIKRAELEQQAIQEEIMDALDKHGDQLK